jgi:hypothetical protein
MTNTGSFGLNSNESKDAAKPQPSAFASAAAASSAAAGSDSASAGGGGTGSARGDGETGGPEGSVSTLKRPWNASDSAIGGSESAAASAMNASGGGGKLSSSSGGGASKGRGAGGVEGVTLRGHSKSYDHAVSFAVCRFIIPSFLWASRRCVCALCCVCFGGLQAGQYCFICFPDLRFVPRTFSAAAPSLRCC